MLNVDRYNRLCGSLPAAQHVIQWGGSHVWKVGDKVFAIGSVREDGAVFVSFKVSDMVWEIYRDSPGVRPAPYLASRGMKWLQRMDGESIDEATLGDLIAQSHQLVAEKLSRKKRTELGV